MLFLELPLLLVFALVFELFVLVYALALLFAAGAVFVAGLAKLLPAVLADETLLLAALECDIAAFGATCKGPL